MQHQQQHMNYMDGGIDVQDYNNTQSRKAPGNNLSRSGNMSQNSTG